MGVCAIALMEGMPPYAPRLHVYVFVNTSCMKSSYMNILVVINTSCMTAPSATPPMEGGIDGRLFETREGRAKTGRGKIGNKRPRSTGERVGC